MASVRKTQRAFLLQLFSALFLFIGRANHLNLSRFSGPPPRSHARWVQEPFDFPALALLALTQQGIAAHPLALIQDASFLKKSGAHTWGGGKFWNGTYSKVDWGLEISTLALVDLTEHTAYAVESRLTPSFSTETDRVSCALAQLCELQPKIPAHVRYVLVDGWYTKKNYVDGVLDLGWHIVGKLRKDADLWYLAEPKPIKKRGRPAKYEGKVNYKDLKKWKSCGEYKSVPVKTARLWSKSLGCEIRVVLLQPSQKGHVLLYSTDVHLEAFSLIELYEQRFQIEFLFRDGKQHTGLGESQSRSKAGQEYAANAALMAVNLQKLERREEGERGRTLGNEKRRRYTEEIVHQIFEELGIDAEAAENKKVLEKVRMYGSMAA